MIAQHRQIKPIRKHCHGNRKSPAMLLIVFLHRHIVLTSRPIHIYIPGFKAPEIWIGPYKLMLIVVLMSWIWCRAGLSWKKEIKEIYPSMRLSCLNKRHKDKSFKPLLRLRRQSFLIMGVNSTTHPRCHLPELNSFTKPLVHSFNRRVSSSRKVQASSGCTANPDSATCSDVHR